MDEDGEGGMRMEKGGDKRRRIENNEEGWKNEKDENGYMANMRLE